MSMRVMDGVRLPDDSSLTEKERAWVEFIRLTSRNMDPAPTLSSVQALRQIFHGP
jgi:hypothetical protein